MSPKRRSTETPADPLDRKVALTAHIDRSGLTIGGKSRALAAFDRLIGGVVGWPAEFFEGKRAQAQARAAGRTALIQADHAAALKQSLGLSELGRATLERVLRDECRKQDNRTAVAIHAIEEIDRPPPAAEQSDAVQSSPDTDSANLDEDWINIFSNYAEQASSERLRSLWGRVLAGEVRKPGSYSPATLRVIAEMDAEIASAFQEVYRLSVNGISLRPEPFEGAVLEKFAFLEQAGLLQADLSLRRRVDATPDGFGYIVGNDFLLRVTYRPGVTQAYFPIVRITRIGRQIGTIIPRDEIEALRQIGPQITGADKVELCAITGHQDGQLTFDITEVVYEAPPSPARPNVPRPVPRRPIRLPPHG